MDFGILGPLEASEHGRLVPIRGTKQRALLALLLLRSNEAVSVERLVDELWPDEPVAKAVAALRVRVSQLRRTLGREVVVTRAPGYAVVVAPEQLDLHRFERLVAQARGRLREGEAATAAALLSDALALWRGAPLADVAHLDFAQSEIRRLDELRMIATESRIEAELALGRHVDVVSELEALVAQHPLRERLRAHLMLALYRSGRQAEALELYQQTRKMLVDELGLEPAESLQELARSILRHDSALEPPEIAEPVATHRSVLVWVRDRSSADSLLALAHTLAAMPPREVVITHLAAAEGDLGDAAAFVETARARLAAGGVAARGAAFTSSDAQADVVRLASQQEADLLLVDAVPDELDDPRALRETALADASCDVAVVVRRNDFPPLDLRGPVAVPFGGADHDWAAVEVAAWLARGAHIPMRLIGTLADPDRERRDASRLLATASLILQQVAGVTPEPRLVPGGSDGVVAAVGDAAVVVLGVPESWRRAGIGPARLALIRDARASPVVVRRGVRPGGLAPPQTLTRFTWTMGLAVHDRSSVRLEAREGGMRDDVPEAG